MAQQIPQTTLVILLPNCVVKIKRTIENSEKDGGDNFRQKGLGNPITRRSLLITKVTCKQRKLRQRAWAMVDDFA